jgi:hypothetical protein
MRLLQLLRILWIFLTLEVVPKALASKTSFELASLEQLLMKKYTQKILQCNIAQKHNSDFFVYYNFKIRLYPCKYFYISLFNNKFY